MHHPDEFPPLPPVVFPWSEQILHAYNDVKDAYDRAANVPSQDDPDPLRLQFHSNHILHQIMPILQALINEIGVDAWLRSVLSTGSQLVDSKRSRSHPQQAHHSDGEDTVSIHTISPPLLCSPTSSFAYSYDPTAPAVTSASTRSAVASAGPSRHSPRHGTATPQRPAAHQRDGPVTRQQPRLPPSPDFRSLLPKYQAAMCVRPVARGSPTSTLAPAATSTRNSRVPGY
ncbi:hypothetical protein C8F01DRAFT_1088327 [Mycena amicta]|nr:hypothetical protein C8F01DRAFT_1088327 [Mycena amicta]